MGIRIFSIVLLSFWASDTIIAQTIIPNLKPLLREDIRVPDKWELIIETATDDDAKVHQTMENYRKDNYKKLQVANYNLCICKDEWQAYVDRYELEQTALYLPLAFGFKSTHTNCSNAKSYFEKMSDFVGEPSEFIDHLRSIWGDGEGFNDMLYDYRITIRLIENLDLPENCNTSQKKHTVEKGQTLYRLSVIYNVSVEEIQKLNGLGTSTSINSGSVLLIP